jgi:hypothetical protein
MNLIGNIAALRKPSPLQMALLLGAALIVLIVARGLIQLKVSHEQNAERWLDQVSSDLVKLSAYMDQNFDTTFLLLDNVVQYVVAKDISDADGLRKQMSGLALHQTLKDRMAALSHVDVITVIADNGEIINSTRSYPPPKINLADRDYFLDAVQGGAGDASKRRISTPIANRVTGTWTFYISQRLTGDRGQFIGMVVIGLSSSFFSDFFERIGPPSGTTISLFRDDFLLLSRWPRNEKLLGETFRNGAMPAILQNNSSGAGVVFYDGPRYSDETVKDQRILGVRRMERYPLLLTMTVPESTYLAQWRVLKWGLIVGTSLALAITVSFLWVFVRLLRGREADLLQMDRLRRHAEDASHAKSQFLAIVSHELRTPLNGLLGFSELLKDSQLNTEQKGFADMVHASGLQLREIINDVLDMAKIEAGELKIHLSPFPPRELAAGVVELYSQNACIKNISLDFEYADDLPENCLGDSLRLSQVLSNLVNNAIKFTDKGKVQVAVSGCHSESGQFTLRLEVFDTGIGIDEADLKMLFQPFKQVDSFLTRRHGGSGLGLSISKKLVELMQGRIGASSRRGLGSQFWIEVDLAVVPSVVVES